MSKLYERASEYGGGKKSLVQGSEETKERGLITAKEKGSFKQCALSLQPWETPVFSEVSGSIFDLVVVMRHFKEKGDIDPVNGEPLTRHDLIHLNFHTNSKGEYHDPVVFKTFNEHSELVAIRPTGNVYLKETVRSLNIQPKSFHDLIDDTTFEYPGDVLSIYNKLQGTIIRDASTATNSTAGVLLSGNQNGSSPPSVQKSSGIIQADANSAISSAHTTATTPDTAEKADTRKPISRAKAKTQTGGEIRQGPLHKKILQEVSKREQSRTKTLDSSIISNGDRLKSGQDAAPDVEASFPRDHSNSHGSKNWTTNACASSLTSTSYDPASKNERVAANSSQALESRWRLIKSKHQKGYAQIQTNRGNLNIQLHCDITPATCDNFLTLSKRGYFNGSVFHRLIKGFMMQGGDPTGTGRGGESAWGGTFKDEMDASLTHDARGILSMANSGKNTNKSQFFITFAPCHHLDRKHTVFGKVVGGMKVLDELETVDVDRDSNQPNEPIEILKVEVFADPGDKVDAESSDEGVGPESSTTERELEKEIPWTKNVSEQVFEPKTGYHDDRHRGDDHSRNSVGKYLVSNRNAKSKNDKPSTGMQQQVSVSLPPSSSSPSPSSSSLKKSKKSTLRGGKDQPEDSKKSKKLKSGFSDFSAW